MYFVSFCQIVFIVYYYYNIFSLFVSEEASVLLNIKQRAKGSL